MLDPIVLVALAGAGLAAGFVDAVAGGGGLIGLPALLAAGVPPIAALATNKMQSAIGTSIAAYTYWRRGLVRVRQLVLAIVLTFAGSYLGAVVVKSVDVSLLRYIIPVALIAIAAYFLFAPNLTDASRASRLDFSRFAPVVGFVIGFYDGAFGPGTGTFFTVAFVTLFGLGLTHAAGHTKVMNLTSNLAALALFIPAGDVVWQAAIVMGIGQIAGGYIGALTGIRYGAKIIRPLVIAVAVILAVRLLVFG